MFIRGTDREDANMYLEPTPNEHDRDFENLRTKVREGITQIENGAFVEYTDENLHELLGEFETEGLRELETRRSDAYSKQTTECSDIRAGQRIECL
jgi:hypothetical protein